MQNRSDRSSGRKPVSSPGSSHTGSSGSTSRGQSDRSKRRPDDVGMGSDESIDSGGSLDRE